MDNCVSQAPESVTPRMAVLPLTPETIEAVRVTAADFNGSSFDGRPFEPNGQTGGQLPAWLTEALEKKTLYFVPSSTDYARWGVKDADGYEHQVGPGDRLMWLNNRVTAIPGPVWEHLVQRLIDYAKSRRGHRASDRGGMSFEGG